MEAMNAHNYSEVDTEIGRLCIACSAKGITAICPVAACKKEFGERYAKRFGVSPEPGEIPESFRRAVMQAAAGRDYDPVAVDLSGLSAFQSKVLKALQQVPRGQVRTYSWLARKVGKPAAARAVGNAMALNPIPLLLPCHRIVPASGGVGNYGLGIPHKRELLQREGVDLDQL
jgi:methylated-DNA-[protein]-cysteine S-methyltransferase